MRHMFDLDHVFYTREDSFYVYLFHAYLEDVCTPVNYIRVIPLHTSIR